MRCVGVGRGRLQLHNFGVYFDITAVYAHALGPACQRCPSRAWRLVPTIRMVPRLAESCLTNLVASWKSGSDFSRLMMWILLRWPKI